MADETKADLRNRVLRHVGRTPIGQSATSEDAAIVDAAITSFYEEMKAIGNGAGWTDSAIPQRLVLPLRDVIAADAASELQLSDRQQTALALLRAPAYSRFLAQQAITADMHEPAEAEYF